MGGGISLRGVWKKYYRGERHDSLRDLVPALASRMLGRQKRDELGQKEFWALRDISLDVKPGEAVGIIGPNGAGKSTLLKLLTRILRPTRGEIAITGRVGALIEVAAGFHPDLTGRENVYLQGAVMGMTRAEISRKFDAIVEFAGVPEFIDTPVKRYSSGMNARLGFAVAAHMDPDVLLIDEVLSVGDVGFQEKCVTRMRELIARGVPLAFVSHNLTAVVDLCTRAILIDHGEVRAEGNPAQVVGEFRRGRRPETVVAGDGPIQITDVRLLQSDGEVSPLFQTGRPMTIQVHYDARQPIDRPHIAIDIHTADGTYCSGINTRMDACSLGTLDGAGYVELVTPRLSLLPGCYSISAGILDPQGLRPLDLHARAYPFTVVSTRRDFGFVYLEHEWRHTRARAAATAAADEECAV
jgi:lipopolysaccharide transport system ATP-binding protein